MNTILHNQTQKTIDFIVEGRTDFESIKIDERLEYMDFNAKVVQNFKGKKDFVLLDIGGGNGTRIAIPVRYISDGIVYLVDYSAPEAIEYDVDGFARIEFDKSHKDLDFLANEDRQKPKAFVNLRINVPTAYVVLEAALEHGAFYLALEPLFDNPTNAGFPVSEVVKANHDFLDKHITDLFFGAINLRGIERRNKYSALKQLFILDLANALDENGYKTEVFSVDREQLAYPSDSEHFLIARK